MSQLVGWQVADNRKISMQRAKKVVHRATFFSERKQNKVYSSCMISDFINSGIVIRANYFVGDTRAVLSVGFRSRKTSDIPVSLYNENIKTLTCPTCKVLAIFRKPYYSDRYDTWAV